MFSAAKIQQYFDMDKLLGKKRYMLHEFEEKKDTCYC